MRMLQNQTRKRGHDMGAIGIEQRWATQRMRTVWKINDNRRDAGLQYPDDVVWAENLLYGPYGNWNLLDIYYPKSAVKILDEKTHNGFHVIGSDGNRKRVQVIEKLPVIFDIHGGGWQYGDKELYRHYNIALARHGFAVIGFNYRLAPEDCFPAAFTDVNRAMNWVAGNGEHFGLDLNRVFMVGDSAVGRWHPGMQLYSAVKDSEMFTWRSFLCQATERQRLLHGRNMHVKMWETLLIRKRQKISLMRTCNRMKHTSLMSHTINSAFGE